MEDVSSLARELKAHLPWHQARIVFLAQFILALLRSRSCNFYRVAESFQSKAQVESSYRRIKRFFAGYTYCYEQLGKLILQWLNLSSYTLCMDRTNWKFGSKHVNYLVVSIAWQGASIPIAWTCLDKQGGNSSTDERIAIMERVLTLIPAAKIDGLLAVVSSSVKSGSSGWISKTSAVDYGSRATPPFWVVVARISRQHNCFGAPSSTNLLLGTASGKFQVFICILLPDVRPKGC